MIFDPVSPPPYWPGLYTHTHTSEKEERERGREREGERKGERRATLKKISCRNARAAIHEVECSILWIAAARGLWQLPSN